MNMKNDNPSLCRICLQEGAYLPIFEKSDSCDNIHAKISLCVSETVEDVVGFPRHICSSCNTILETLTNFIHKFRETSKILENGLELVKKEVATIDSDHTTSEFEIDVKVIKAESDDDFDNSLVSLVEPLPVILKKNIKKEAKQNPKKTVKRDSRSKTNKIASSILEGNFIWNGDNWCMKMGNTTIRKLSTAKCKEPKPRPQTKINLPDRKEIHSEKLCDLCGDVFKSLDKLSLHKKNVHFKNPVQCPKCPRVCASNYSLNKHIKRIHEGIRDYICSTCGQGFAFKSGMTSHNRNVHRKHLFPERVYSCKFCDKKYKCAKSVIIHERSVHTGQRPAECSICGNCFYHEDYLKEHMRLHTGETPFKCPICGRGYAQRCNMKSHLRIHRISELDATTLSKIRPNYLKLLKV